MSMTAAAFQIEKNIPHTPGGGLGSAPFYPFNGMEVGDSFLVPEGTVTPRGTLATTTSIGQASISFGKTRGRKFSCRKVDGGIRVWRTA